MNFGEILDRATDLQGLNQTRVENMLKVLRTGTDWGFAEAQIIKDEIREGVRTSFPEWTMGAYEGDLPKGTETEREEYEMALDRQARETYETERAAWMAEAK